MSQIKAITYTESTASNFMPVDRINRLSSGSTCWMLLPHPTIRISGKKILPNFSQYRSKAVWYL